MDSDLPQFKSTVTAATVEAVFQQVRPRVAVLDFEANTVTLMSSIDPLPTPEPSEAVKQRFCELVTEWQRETAHLSVTSQRVTNRNFLKILTLGDDILPLVFEEFERKATPAWVTALELFTDDRPAENASNYREAVQRWLKWGEANGYR
jgi:hypothetical protein